MLARWLRIVVVALTCAVAGVFGIAVTPALAAAPEAPFAEVTSRKATPVEEASLRGVLYANAAGEPGSYEFLYKQSASECEGGSKTTSGIATGNQFEEAFQALTGLQAGKQYTVCLSVTSPGGTTDSSPVTFTAPIAVEAPDGLKAESVVAFGATLQGVLNPLAERKAEPGGYEFLYKRSASECEGESATAFTVAAGARAEAVSVPVTGLLAHSQYTFCLRAANEVGEVAVSAPSTFMTPAAAPKVEEASVNDVAGSSATFTAKIDPEGAETAYVFELAPAGGVFARVSVAGGRGVLPEGLAGVSVGVHVQGLVAHASYEFRVVAVNSVESVTSAPVSFTTQVSGASSALPDGREWEMVSPPQKEGVLFWPIREGIIQAAANGNAIEEMSAFEPIEGKAAGTYGSLEANFFGRGSDGWVSESITPPHSERGVVPVGVGMEYRFFSEDLSKAILQPFGPVTPLASGVKQSTPYLRTDYLNGDQGDLCGTGAGAGCYEPLVSESNVPPGTPYGEEQSGPCQNTSCGPVVVAVTPDLSHVVLTSAAALTPDSKEDSKEGRSNIYEWAGGKLTFVGEGVLPVGPENQNDEIVRHSVSDDGSRVFIDGTYGGVSGLLMRDTVTGEVLQVGPGSFQDASNDGSKVFLNNNGELLEYNLDAPAGDRVVDLSVDPHPGEQPGVVSVVGASEDGSYVYFAATGALAPGATPAGCGGSQPCMNLYEYHEGVIRFVAGLGGEDYPDWSLTSKELTARVSPDGRWLTFMSDRDLTGYDTNDAISGFPDEEVYLYNADAAKLVCASCNPTGAHPVGVEYQREGAKDTLVGGDRIFNEKTWIASNVPPVTRYELLSVSYQSRYLSDSGRLFFDSHDALVPQDVNGTQDVYEYEPVGIGDCVVSKATFNQAIGGCVSLISSGESSQESAFLDASETGGDVFFLTAAKLVSKDTDSALDVYDARECGSDGSRCLAVEPVSPPPCDTGDSCKAAPSPQPAVFGSPASATFSGTGDATSPSKPATVTGRSATKTQLLRRALKGCQRRKGRRRKQCERQARARYAAKSLHMTSKTGGRGR
jgi:hypothetical protein